MKKLEEYVRSIPDFPEKGIIFRDVTSVLQDADGLHLAINEMDKCLEGIDYDVVVGPEARGFLFGCPVATALDAGFVPVRKPGKLPRETISKKYDLEYGSNEIFMHKDSISKGQNVLIVDDLLATGGTVAAAVSLIEEMGGNVVGIAFLIELEALEGKEVLKDYDVYSVLKY